MTLLLLASGCGDPCADGACDAGRSALGVALGGDGALAAVEPGLVLEGDAEQGVDWTLAVGGGSVLLGAPDADSVWSLSEPLDGALEAAGSLVGEGGFGASVSARDGFLLVGAPERDVGSANPRAGSAWLFEDLGDGFEGERGLTGASFTLLGEQPAQRVGEQVALCDVDGDALPDLLVSATWDGTGANLGGRVFLALGSELEEAERVVGSLPLSWWSEDEGAQLGRSLACADLDGDGLDELLVGAPFADGPSGDATGAVYVLHAPFTAGSIDERATVVLTGRESQAYLGWALAVCDLDADGVPELFGGAPGTSDGEGEVAAWTPSGSLRTLYQGEGGRFGASLTCLDHDGDGAQDLAVGAPSAGRVSVWAGAEGLDWSRLQAQAEAPGQLQGGALLGRRVGAGDLDADGDEELLLTWEP